MGKREPIERVMLQGDQLVRWRGVREDGPLGERLERFESEPAITPARSADPALVAELRQQAAYAPPPARAGESTDTLEDTLKRIHERIIAPRNLTLWGKP